MTPFSDEWKSTGNILEIDTDGIYMTLNEDLDNINSFISDKVYKNFGISDCTLELEKETFERGFIHKMKNYMLIEKRKGKDHIIVHGAYFKSSRASKVYDDAVQNVIDWALFDKFDEVEAKNRSLNGLRQRPIDDFVMRIKLSKNIKDYNLVHTEYYDTNKNVAGDFNPITSEIVYTTDDDLNSHQIIALALQYGRITGNIPEKGTILQYFTAVDILTGKKIYLYYNAKDTTQRSVINFQAYENQIERLFNDTNICKIGAHEEEEANWFNEFGL